MLLQCSPRRFIASCFARRLFIVVLALTKSYFAENLNTVFEWNVSPGFKIVLGKSG